MTSSAHYIINIALLLHYTSTITVCMYGISRIVYRSLSTASDRDG